MAGLLAGLRACPTPWLALIPVDNPCFPCEAFDEALQRLGVRSGAVGWIDHEDRSQWLPGLYHRDAIPSLEDSLSRGELRFGLWVKAQRAEFLPWKNGQVSASRAFSNFNTPGQARAGGFGRAGG